MRSGVFFLSITLLLMVVVGISLSFGSVSIPLSEIIPALLNRSTQQFNIILRDYRLPRVIAALISGASLGGAGLLMQALFRNPLAGPSILGISSGASLGASLVLLTSFTASSSSLFGGVTLGGYGVVALASMLGSFGMLLIILLVSRRIESATGLLLFGVMFGYGINAFVSILIHFSSPEQVQSYIAWTFGDFSSVSWKHLSLMVPALLVGVMGVLLMAKPLDGLLLGESYARSMGQSVKLIRAIIILITALLAGVVTAFCGPIAFIGLAAPHMARLFTGKGNHKFLISATLLTGGCIGVVADIIAQLPGSLLVLPLNSVTALFGAPVVLILLLRQRKQGGM